MGSLGEDENMCSNKLHTIVISNKITYVEVEVEFELKNN